MTEATTSRRPSAALATLLLSGAFLAADCSRSSQPEISEDKKGASVDPDPSVLDGGLGTPMPLRGDVYWRRSDPSGNEVYRLLIGDNLHAVTGCGIQDFNAILANPSNRPQLMLEQFAKMKDLETGALYPARAGFSCGEEPGALPLATTAFYLDEAAGRYYFPSGTSGEYYSFTDRDACLIPLQNKLFKIDQRIGSYWWNLTPGKPRESAFKEIPLTCDHTLPSGSTYRLYADRDLKVPTRAASGDYVVVEVKDGSGYAYLPVRQINGADVAETLRLLESWLGLPHQDPLPPLSEASALKGGDESATWAKIDQWKANRRFWDLCLPSSSAPATECKPTSSVYGVAAPFASALPTAPPAPTKYREELRIDGTSVTRAVEETVGSAPVASYPFTGCDGALEATFGLARDPVLLNRREWTMAQSRIVAALPTLEPCFRCPTAGNDRVCRLALGGAQGPDKPQTYDARQVIDSIDAAYQICSTQQRTDLLEITLNSPVDVDLLPDSLRFGRFRSVSIKSGSGTNYLRFHEQCKTAAQCLASGAERTRPIIAIYASDPTRSLTVDHVAFQYVAHNLASPDSGVPVASFFNLNGILLLAQGTAESRVRVVFTDSSIGADLDSSKFLSQAVNAKFADIFVVRSTLQGSADPSSELSTLSAANSLVVLDGRPAPGSPAASNGALLTALRGAAAGLTMSEGSNDVLSVSSVVDGVLVANAISQSTWIDSMLNRPVGRPAIFFKGAESSGFPSPNTMMWTGALSRITNFQDSLNVPVVQFESYLAAVPRVTFAKEVKFMNGTSSASTEVPLEALRKTLFCNTARGSVQLLNGLNQRCPPK